MRKPNKCYIYTRVSTSMQVDGYSLDAQRDKLRKYADYEGIEVHSLWELIDSDPTFSFPDYRGLKAYVQDCWRSRDRRDEQDAVRNLLAKMRVEVIEPAKTKEQTEFCGASLYRAQPPRNPKLAPKHYVDGAGGKFIPHSPEEQKEIMQEYCRQFCNNKVVCYCHYCLEGLLMGQASALHLAQLLFEDNTTEMKTKIFEI